MQANDLELQIVEAVEAGQARTALRLRNVAPSELGDDWRLYVSFGLMPLGPELEFTSVEGRFGYLAPGPDWRPLASGAVLEVPVSSWIFAGNRLIDRQGFLLTTLEGNQEVRLGAPAVLPALLASRDTSAHDFIRAQSPSALTDLMTPERAYQRFESGDADEQPQASVVPGPGTVRAEPGTWLAGAGSALDAGPFKGVAGWLSDLPDAGDADCVGVSFEHDGSIGDEAYTLDANGTGVVIRASGPRGAFYGAQSLLQLASAGSQRSIAIRDQPLFPFRAVYLDIARHFPTQAPIERLIRAMGRYKLNVLVLGISNDEGWRLEVPGMPELTSIGGVRRFDPEDDSSRALPPALGDDVGGEHAGFLSRGAFVGLLRLAAAHHVEVVLEFNLPGHANALIRALASSGRYEVVDRSDRSTHASHQGYAHNTVNPCVPGTYAFARAVISAFKKMYDEAGVPFRRLHCGGDETPDGTWLRSPACATTPGWDAAWTPKHNAQSIRDHVMRRHFRELVRVAREVAPGLELGFWHEMADYVDDGAEGVWLNDWTTHRGQDDVRAGVASSGLPVVIANASYLYFDMPYACHPDEVGLPWATYIDTRGVLEFDSSEVSAGRESGVLGLQAHLWSETVYEPELVDFYLFPRLLAFAERCWSRREPDWPSFAQSVGRELAWLDARSVAFRIAPPGVTVRDGLAHAAAEFPGLLIRYSADGAPVAGSPVYESPVPVSNSAGLWFSAWFGDRSSRAVRVGAAE